MIHTGVKLAAAAACLWMVAAAEAVADIATVYVGRDASIYSEPTPLANGSGSYLFAGVTGPNNSSYIRRSMLYFDVSAALPPQAVVTSATLRLNIDQEPFGADASVAYLHTAEADWGEGPSDPNGAEGTGTGAGLGDATWTQSFHTVTDWSSPGGDFDPAASDSTTVDGPGLVFFSSPAMVSDVQAWYDTPSQNFGWFLIGDETGIRNARRFTSGEDPDLESIIPELTIGYTVVPEPATWVMLAGGLLLLRRRRGRFSFQFEQKDPP